MDEGPYAVLTEAAFEGFDPVFAGRLTGVIVRLWRVGLWLSVRFGRIVRFVLVDGVGVTTVVAVVAVAVLALSHSWTAALIVGGGWGLALLGLASFGARQRVLIGEFGVLLQPAVAGVEQRADVNLADLLVGEISRLVDLFNVVGDRRAVSSGLGSERAFDATMSSEGLMGALKGAVTPDSKVSVGPVTLPVAPILALLGAVLKAPRLTGGLHRDGNVLILTAEMSRRRGLTWIVTGNLSASEANEEEATDRESTDGPLPDYWTSGDDAVVMSMVRQMALRIFTDVALGRSVRWNATQSFVAGLQAFRVCLRTPRDRKVNLKSAERDFLRALVEDEDFPLAHYNLGVVYTQLHGLAVAGGREREAAEHLRAAETAFGRAIEKDSTRWETCFAYAQTQYRYGRYGRVVELTKRIRRLSRGGVNSAKVAELEARALMMLGRHREAIKCARTASRRALWALVRARVVRRGSIDAELDSESRCCELAAACLLTYGEVFAMQIPEADQLSSNRIVCRWQTRILRRSEAIFWLARILTRRAADSRFKFGLRALRQGWLDTAVMELEEASQSEPTRPVFLACLALSHARRHSQEGRHADDEERAIDLCWETLELMAGAYNPARDSGSCEILALAFKELGQPKRAKGLIALADEVRKTQGRGDEARRRRGRGDEVRQRQARGDEVRKRQGRAAIERIISTYFLGALDEPGSQADASGRGHFVRAVADASDILARYTKGVVAAAESPGVQAPEKGVLGEALKWADRATSLNPLSGLAWETLGDVYGALSDFGRARASWKSALAADPDNPALYTKIGWSYWYPAFEKDGQVSRVELASAAEQFKDALLLYDSQDLDQQALTHYRLGKLEALLRHFPDARAELRIVDAMAPPWNPPVVGWVQLGLAYLEHDQYPECEHFLDRAADASDRLAESGHPANLCVGQLEDEAAWPLGLVRAWAHLGLAFSLIKRDGDLRVASEHVTSARRAVGDVDSKRPTKRALAACSDAEGEIALLHDDIRGGITRLRESVSIYPFSASYIHLALALQRSQRAANKVDTDEVKRLLQHARTLRPSGAPTRELDEAEAALASAASGNGK